MPTSDGANSPLLVNNTEFLVLPWIRISNMVSHILAECEKCLTDDWISRRRFPRVLPLKAQILTISNRPRNAQSHNSIKVCNKRNRPCPDFHIALARPDQQSLYCSKNEFKLANGKSRRDINFGYSNVENPLPSDTLNSRGVYASI